MALDDKLKVTRNQLAEFIPNHDTLRKFELLFDRVNFFGAPDVTTITDATNVDKSFPLAEEISGNRRIYRRTGAGAGTLTITTQNSEELILLNGTSVTSIVLSGEETLEIYEAEGKLWVLTN